MCVAEQRRESRLGAEMVGWRAIITLAVGSSEAPTGSGIAPASNESEARAVPVANARDVVGVESVSALALQPERSTQAWTSPTGHACPRERGGDSRV
jgi:hypothetical protein